MARAPALEPGDGFFFWFLSSFQVSAFISTLEKSSSKNEGASPFHDY
jgi:hypothetical protein